MIKRILKKLEEGIYTKENIIESKEQVVRDIPTNRNYLCNTKVDNIFDEDGNKLYKVEQHIQINGDYRFYLIFNYKTNEHTSGNF